MSQHRDYLLSHRVNKLDRAVGFVGEVNVQVSDNTRSTRKPGGYYYNGTPKTEKKEKKSYILIYIFLPILVVFFFGLNPLLGIISMIASLLVTYKKLINILDS